MDKNQDDWLQYNPDLPIAISYVGGRYLLFDIKTVSWLRREHSVCGYNIGTLPQNPSQNVFLGLPIILVPEEAQFLIEKGVAYILDDARAHDQAIYDRKSAYQLDYLAKARRQASEVEQIRAQEHAEARGRALSKQKAKTKTKPRAKGKDQNPESDAFKFDDGPSPDQVVIQDTPVKLLTTPANAQSYHVTPATSRLLIDALPESTTCLTTKTLPGLPSSYPFFRHLHERGYFMTPGLRFGCQYSTYPGDPLRFHSHFLAVGLEWEEEIDLMEIVGGGRLGTGVKKGFLLGGVEPAWEEKKERVRTFSVEWAVM